MKLNNRIIFLVVLVIFVPFLSGCFVNLNNEPLEEHGNKIRLTMATLIPYVGKSKEDVKRNFGEPTDIKREEGFFTDYKDEKIKFDEIWDYIYRRGIPGINAEGSTKTFYFYKGIVVEVEAF